VRQTSTSSGPAEIVQSSQLDHADHQAVSSKLWDRRRKKPESRRCCAEHVEQTVDDVWQIADGGDRELRNRAHIVVGEIRWSPMPETTMDCHSKLVLHPLRNTQPVQIIMHQPRQTTIVFPSHCLVVSLSPIFSVYCERHCCYSVLMCNHHDVVCLGEVS